MAAGIIILHDCITNSLIVWDSLNELDLVIYTFQRGNRWWDLHPSDPAGHCKYLYKCWQVHNWHQSCTKSSNKPTHHNCQQMSYLVTWKMTLPSNQHPNMDHPVGNLSQVCNLSLVGNVSPVAGLQAHASAQVLPLPCQSKNHVLSPQAMKLPPSSFQPSHQIFSNVSARIGFTHLPNATVWSKKHALPYVDIAGSKGNLSPTSENETWQRCCMT